jgi:hypothetical protein
MLQSAQCVFPQVALFLEFKEVCRLDTVSRDIIPESWESEVWNVAANSACTGFRSFQFSNLQKQTIRELMKHVVYTTPVIGCEAIVVDSERIASKLLQFASEMSMPRSLAAKTLFARFRFDEEALQEYAIDSSAVPYSFPVIFDIGDDKYTLEMSMHSDGLKLSMNSLKHCLESDECKDYESDDDVDDDEDANLVAFSKPMLVQLCSVSSPVLLRNEYVLTHVDEDVYGFGICDTPSSHEMLGKALVEGFDCMISVHELTQGELRSEMPCNIEC